MEIERYGKAKKAWLGRLRAIITREVDEKLKEVCKGIEARYEIKFLEIRTEKDHVHFLVQKVPTYSPA
jgi:REP element-mobilizing transposase RayT